MSNARFSVLDAVMKAYAFAGANRGYLLRVGAAPLLLQTATAACVQTWRPEASLIEVFLWALPANIAFAWLMFAETRFLLLGERVDRLPQDALYLHDRRHALRLCVIMLLLCDMGFTGAMAWLEWSVNARILGVDPRVTAAGVLLLGVMFWALRFFVVPLLAAVGHPVRPFLLRVRGAEFPARLLALGVLCTMPVYLVLMVLLDALFPEAQDLTQAQMMEVTLVSAPVAYLAPVLMNAAAAFALKDLLGRAEKKP